MKMLCFCRKHTVPLERVGNMLSKRNWSCATCGVETDTLPEHLSSPSVFRWVDVAQCVVFSVVFWRS